VRATAAIFAPVSDMSCTECIKSEVKIQKCPGVVYKPRPSPLGNVQSLGQSLAKGLDIYMPPLIGKLQQQRFTILEVAYWAALAIGGAAQLAAAHFQNERTSDRQ